MSIKEVEKKETAGAVDYISVDQISIANNPRTTIDKVAMTELIESIKTNGILAPVLVRVIGTNGSTKYELIAGHRRVAAAKALKIEKVPALIKSMLDHEADSARLIENLQRVDLEPLEEAKAFKRLIEQFNYSVDGVASQVQKGADYVRTRLKLLDLIPDVQAALADHRLMLGQAFLIARLPLDHQATAFKALCPKNEEAMSMSQAHHYITTNFMLQLKGASFDTTDVTLVPAAGACTTCPKRTGNAKELFNDITKADTCTDLGCFQSKQLAGWERAKQKAEGDPNVQVLTDKEIKSLYPYTHSNHVNSNRFIELDDECYDAKGSKTYRKLLGQSKPKVYLALRPDGKVAELVEKTDAIKTLRELKVPLYSDQNYSGRSSSASANAAYRLTQKVESAAEREVLRRIFDGASEWAESMKGKLVSSGSMLMMKSAIDGAWHDSLKLVCAVHDLDTKGKSPADVLKAEFGKVQAFDQFAVAIQLMAARSSSSRDGWLKLFNAGSTDEIAKKIRFDLKAKKEKKVSGTKKAVKSQKKK